MMTSIKVRTSAMLAGATSGGWSFSVSDLLC